MHSHMVGCTRDRRRQLTQDDLWLYAVFSMWVLGWDSRRQARARESILGSASIGALSASRVEMAVEQFHRRGMQGNSGGADHVVEKADYVHGKPPLSPRMDKAA